MSKRKASYECSSSPRKQRNCHGDCLGLFSTESSSPIPDVHTCLYTWWPLTTISFVSFEKYDRTPAIHITLWLAPRVINFLYLTLGLD